MNAPFDGPLHHALLENSAHIQGIDGPWAKRRVPLQ